jgi:adenylate cyclase class 2
VAPRRKTNREIEIKLGVSDVTAVLSKLAAIGAVSQGRVLERNTLYDTPQSDLRGRGRLLRLRIEKPAPNKGPAARPQRAVLTAKAPPEPRGAGWRSRPQKSRYKERAERELVVADPRFFRAALKSLGFRPGFRYEKYRTTLIIPSVPLVLDLDETPFGVFLELEGAPASIDRVARLLGYASGDYFRGTYWDLYVKDCRQHGRRPGNMVFHEK